MTDEQAMADIRGQLQQRAPAQFVALMAETEKVAFGSSSGKHTGEWAIDCMIPFDAIKHQDPDSAMCNIWLDDQAIDDVSKSDWQAFLKAYNLLQFLPLCGFSTAKGIQSGVYEVVPFGTVPGNVVTVEELANSILLEDVLENVRPALSKWLETGRVAPTVGCEHANNDGEIIAEAELCWNDHRIAGLLEDQLEYQPILQEQGWQIVTLDDAGQWLKTHPLASLAGI